MEVAKEERKGGHLEDGPPASFQQTQAGPEAQERPGAGTTDLTPLQKMGCRISAQATDARRWGEALDALAGVAVGKMPKVDTVPLAGRGRQQGKRRKEVKGALPGPATRATPQRLQRRGRPHPCRRSSDTHRNGRHTS